MATTFKSYPDEQDLALTTSEEEVIFPRAAGGILVQNPTGSGAVVWVARASGDIASGDYREVDAGSSEWFPVPFLPRNTGSLSGADLASVFVAASTGTPTARLGIGSRPA
jgi:hypothetical protein